MGNIYFYLIILSLVVNTFQFTFSYSNVNRSMLMMGNSIPESSIVMFNQENEEEIYFDLEKIKEQTIVYYKNNIEEYVISGELYVTLFMGENDYRVCTDTCKGAAVRLKATLPLYVSYDRQIEFIIRKG